MAAKVHQRQPGHWAFHCPGCREDHHFAVPRWAWDGSIDRPTFSPSLLVTSGHYCAGFNADDSCWCTRNAEHPDDAVFGCYRCHSFVRDGRIEFLSDCTHALAGQTVELPDWET